MKQRVAVLTAAVGTVLAAPLLMTATANADVWQPVPGISIPLPDGVFRGLPGVIAIPPPPAPGPPPVAGAPCNYGGVEDGGTWVHLEGGNAAHYGTEWMCEHNPDKPWP